MTSARISGGTQVDLGLASGATIFTGSQVIEAGGTASGTVITADGSETVLAGGTDFGAQVGGFQDVFGFASGALVFDDSGQQVESGGTASGTTLYGDSGGKAWQLGSYTAWRFPPP